MGRQVPTRAGVGASGPAGGTCLRQSCCLLLQAGGGPRGKQSARGALPCVPLVVCLNSGALTAFGGCAHWARASLRSPLHPFGSPSEAIEHPVGLQALSPAPESARHAPAGGRNPHRRALPPFPSPFSYSGSPTSPMPNRFLFSFAAERKRRPPSFRLNLLHSGTSFSKEFRAGEKERGRLSNRGFPCFSRLDMP